MITSLLIATAIAGVMVPIAIVVLIVNMVRDWRWQNRMDEIENERFRRVVKDLDREFADIDEEVEP